MLSFVAHSYIDLLQDECHLVLTLFVDSGREELLKVALQLGDVPVEVADQRICSALGTAHVINRIGT